MSPAGLAVRAGVERRRHGGGMGFTAGRYIGHGDGIVCGPFDATMEITALSGGSWFAHDVAVSATEGELHREHNDGLDGIRWASGPPRRPHRVAVTTMAEAAPGELIQPEALGPYEGSIHVDQPAEDRLRWAWWWAPPARRPSSALAPTSPTC